MSSRSDRITRATSDARRAFAALVGLSALGVVAAITLSIAGPSSDATDTWLRPAAGLWTLCNLAAQTVLLVALFRLHTGTKAVNNQEGI